MSNAIRKTTAALTFTVVAALAGGLEAGDHTRSGAACQPEHYTTRFERNSEGWGVFNSSLVTLNKPAQQWICPVDAQGGTPLSGVKVRVIRQNPQYQLWCKLRIVHKNGWTVQETQSVNAALSPPLPAAAATTIGLDSLLLGLNHSAVIECSVPGKQELDSHTSGIVSYSWLDIF
jgi:hypothetical protein